MLKIDDDYANSESSYLNGYTDIGINHTRQRSSKQHSSIFSTKSKTSKCKSITDNLSAEAQDLLLEELLKFKKPSVVDVISRLLFPVLFILFNLCYWLIYLDQSHLKQ